VSIDDLIRDPSLLDDEFLEDVGDAILPDVDDAFLSFMDQAGYDEHDGFSEDEALLDEFIHPSAYE
jgi:hypothetical protein